ncbi:MAG: HAD family hydrolase [Methanobacteriota archaeon]|nr:MAG: HAD family hydrolase [Euryarchaeota archaeon]
MSSRCVAGPQGIPVARPTAQLSKPYIFFDLGETIVNLRDTIGVIASFIGTSYPSLARRATDLAKSWFVGLASSVPRDPDAKFESQYDVGRRVLARVLRESGESADDAEAGRLLRAAWDRWQEGARLCEGVTKEWLHEVGLLSAGVGAVTDGDEADVRRLLAKMSLSRYFDSVTTSEAVKAYKPNPVVYRVALASLGADPRNSAFVSDSPLDLVGAREVGMTTVWLHHAPGESAGGPPPGTLRVTKPRELNRILVHFNESGRFEM